MAGRAAGRVGSARSAREEGGNRGGEAAGLGPGVAKWGRAQAEGRGTSRAVCLRASIYDNQKSNSLNHPELPER